jgi:hypothetical protein
MEIEEIEFESSKLKTIPVNGIRNPLEYSTCSVIRLQVCKRLMTLDLVAPHAMGQFVATSCDGNENWSLLLS